MKNFLTALSSFLFIPLFGKIYLFEIYSTFKTRSSFTKDKFTFLLITLSICIYIFFIDAGNFSEESIVWIGTFILIFFSFNYFTSFAYEELRDNIKYLLLGFSFSLFLINDSYWFSELELFDKFFASFCFFFIYQSFFSKFKYIFFFLAIFSMIITADRLLLISFIFSHTLRINIFDIKSIFLIIVSMGFFFFILNPSSDYIERISYKNQQTLNIKIDYGNPFLNYVIGSRHDILPMLEGIKKKPLVGYGSSGFDKIEESQLLKLNPLYILEQNRRDRLNDRGVVLHSMLLGHWVRYGLIGLLYVLFFLYYPLKILFDFKKKPVFLYFICFFLITSILFEPGRNRFLTVIFISLLHVYIQQKQNFSLK